MTDYVIETKDLSVYYGRHRGIVDVNLQVERGEIFGFLGPNGAGKTTTERVLMGVIHPTAGKAYLFGKDCNHNGVEARARVGYLPGELSLYDDMRASDFFRMYASLQNSQPGPEIWSNLAEQLQLDTTRKIRQFSRGNKQKVGIVAAFMSKPDLLILDEPTSGLDPLVQQTVLDLVSQANQAGTTVFFSSHILSEVQAVCDRVGIIRDGRLVATERVEDMTRQHFKRVRFEFANTPDASVFDLEGVQIIEQTDQGIKLEVYQQLDKVMEKAASYTITDIETIPVTLEEIFLAYYGKGKGANHA